MVHYGSYLEGANFLCFRLVFGDKISKVLV
jgi:hypothetical protein